MRAGLLLLVAAPFVLEVANGLWGQQVRDPVVAFACRVTGCAAPGMTVAGWLIIMMPVALVAFGFMPFRRWSRPVQWAYGIGTGLVAVLTWFFIPGRGTELDDLLDGYGKYAFATGLRWAGLCILAVIAAVVTGAALKRTWAWPAAAIVAGVACLVLLGVAISRGAMPPMTAAAMFADKTWTSAGDTLTVTSTEDLDGCDGVVANQPLLRGCIRTAKATFTTDDSDAVVHLAAVLFPSPDIAGARRDDLPDGTGQQGITGATRSTRMDIDGWLILTSVRHADGREIANADVGHLLWAIKQVNYQFTSSQVGLYVAPNPNPPIAPRTP